MQIVTTDLVLLGLFNLGGGEIILILALVLILFGAKKLPELARGLGQGIDLFGKSCCRFSQELDDEASDAGRSVGGIYGKAAAQAIAPDNQVAELYDPAVLGERTRFAPRKEKPAKLPQTIIALVRAILDFWRVTTARLQRALGGPR